MKNLVGGGLADIQDGFTLQVVWLDLLIHRTPPGRLAPRFLLRFLRERLAIAPAIAMSGAEPLGANSPSEALRPVGKITAADWPFWTSWRGASEPPTEDRLR